MPSSRLAGGSRSRATALVTLVAALTVLGCADQSPPRFSGSELTFAWTADRLDIVWPAASDDVQLEAYVLSVDGSAVARLDRAASRYTVEGVRERTSHVVRLTAVDTAGNESAPLEGRYDVPDHTPPVFPVDAILRARGDEEQVTFRWPPASDEGVLHYRVLIGEREIATVEEPTLTVPRSAVGESPEAPSVIAIDDADHRSTVLLGRWEWNPRIGLAVMGGAHGAPPLDPTIVDRLLAGTDDDGDFDGYREVLEGGAFTEPPTPSTGDDTGGFGGISR